MFTGLVENVGVVEKIEESETGARWEIRHPFETPAVGDSIAVNGCCLTVTKTVSGMAYFDLLAQTLRVTSLCSVSPGSVVNLERAMLASTRLGGHFVQGHVDATGTISVLEPVGQDFRLEVILPENLKKYCIDKGSLTVDGISLTIAELKENTAIFWITPHTWDATNLSHAKLGQLVNIEVDVLAKYVESLLSARGLV